MYNYTKKELQEEFPTPGYLYIVFSPTFHTLIKIGKTYNISSRLTAYNSANPNEDFQFLAISRVVEDTKKYEEELKHLLGNAKFRNEWFDVTLKDKAIEYINNI